MSEILLRWFSGRWTWIRPSEFTIPVADINPVNVYRHHISFELSMICGADKDLIYNSLGWTQSLENGDLSLGIQNLPTQTSEHCSDARKWARKLANDTSFFFSPASLPQIVLPCVYNLGPTYGFNPIHGTTLRQEEKHVSKKIVIEFSSPNVGKALHVGHLTSTIIRGFLANLYESNGWNVWRMNHLGDWGRHIGLLAIGWEKYGSEEELERNAVTHLFDVYVQICKDFRSEEKAHDRVMKANGDTAELETKGLLGASKSYFKGMEEGDTEKLALFERFRNMSIELYKKSCARLGIEFDEYSGESQVQQVTMDSVEAILESRGISEVWKGSTSINFAKHGAPNLKRAMIRKRNDTASYLLRDIASAIERYEEHEFDQMLYAIMSEQYVHAHRIFKALELMGGEYKEISQKLRLVDFHKSYIMCTERGTGKFLDEILNNSAAIMRDIIRRHPKKYDQIRDPHKLADTLGIAAVLVQDTSWEQIKKYASHLSGTTSSEGKTGPYLQYAHAQLCSVLRNGEFVYGHSKKVDLSLLTETYAVELIRVIAQFPDIINNTLTTLEATTVSTYLFRLARQALSCYDHLQVTGSQIKREASIARAMLYDAARQVLQNGLKLLGIAPIDQM